MNDAERGGRFGVTAVIAAAVAVSLLLLLGVVLYDILTDRAASYLLRDATSVGGVLPEAGAVSEFGIGVWTVSAAVCAFTGALLFRCRDRDWSVFFWVTSALLAWFALDDQYQVHETLVRKYLGIGGSVYIVVYGVAILAWLWIFRRRLVDGWQILAAALAALFVSVMSDFVTDRAYEGESDGSLLTISADSMGIVEDYAKLLGILLWATFLVRLAYRRSAERVIQQPESPK
ncbi:MAG: hypothetical protein K0U64_05540 [Actinomycetia bacterium]|nr:hypothetical protein [Actinomycetes bacterium]